MKMTFYGNGIGFLPSCATEGAAGMDVCSVEDLVIAPLQRVLVNTGLSCEIPEDSELQVRPRSGLALKHGVTVLNSPGTIDSDYRGQIKVLLINLGQEDFVIKKGDRIAQLVLARVERPHFVDWKFEGGPETQTKRGDGGYGSTGVSA